MQDYKSLCAARDYMKAQPELKLVHLKSAHWLFAAADWVS